MARSCPTEKQIKFAEAYMVSGNATDAYYAAGYKCSNRAFATREAYKLKKHPAVIKLLDERQQARMEKNELSVEYVVAKLQKIVEDTDKANPQAALRGLELLGRHLGMYRDRQEISGPDGEAIRVEEQKVENDVADFRSRIASIASRNKPDLKVVND